jgi:GMP synthase-like glutamine amidotransferase
MLMIIDNQSAYLKKFKREFLSEQDFDYIFFDHNQPIVLSEKAKIEGIILSGGKGNPYEPLNLSSDFIAMMNFDVPVLGICLGHEIIAVAHRGRIKKLSQLHSKKEEINIIIPEDPIFEGIKEKTILIQKKHSFCVSTLPENFICLASSQTCANEIIRHNKKPIYGIQGHPEVNSKKAMQLIKNFIKMCNMQVNE